MQFDDAEPSSPLNLSLEPKIDGKFVDNLNLDTTFPFEEKTTLFEGDSLKIYVQKVSFMRQKKFILDDHQFTVRAESLNDKPPLLSSILSVLEKSLEYMLNNLRQFYKEEDKNLVYLTIFQNDMDSAINSGAFEISSTNNNVILSHVLGMFNRFIRSNASVRLEKDFSVYFRVLSAAHVNHASNRRGAIIRDKFCDKNKTYGCPFDDSCTKRTGCDEIPIGYFQNKLAFKDKCLLVHIILGYYCFAQKHNVPTENNITYKDLMKIYSPNKNVQNKAGNLLQSIICKVTADLNLSINGPYSFQDLGPLFSNYYNCQIHVINGLEQTKVSILSEPEIYDDTKNQIYLLSTMSNHVILISNLKSFFRKHRKVCFECKQTFSKNHYHVCKSKAMCHFCKSFYATEFTIDDPAIRYCDSQIKTPLTNKIECQKCDMEFITEKCFKLHKPLCHSRWHCRLCSRTLNIFPKTAQQLKAEHVCHLSSKCKFCRLDFQPDEYHLCKIPNLTGDKYWPNLVFFQFAFQNLNSGNCLNCFQLQNNYCKEHNLEFKNFKKQKVFGNILCSRHSSKTINNQKPNACILFREISRGKFEQYTICDDDLLGNDETKKGCDFDFCYSNSTVNMPYQNVNVGGRKRVRTNDLTCKIKALEDKAQKTMLEKFFLLCTQIEWENSVYISHQAQLVNLPAILETCLNFGIIPNIVQKNSSIHILEIEILKCRFLNGSSFLAGTLEEICKQFEIPYDPVYFPENFNCPENYSYSGSFPDLEQYLLFTDSPIEKTKKQNFVTSNQFDYFNFKDQLLNVLKIQCEAFTMACLKFLKESIDFQVQLQIYLKTKDHKIIHPFGQKCSSISSLSYNQFSLFYLQDVDLYATKFDYTGGNTKVSTLEYEFTCYLDFLSPEVKYEHAFNCANGQKTFGYLKADLYSPITKTVYNFHGCKFHYCDTCDTIKTAKRNANNEPVNHFNVPYATLKIKDEKIKNTLLGKFGKDVEQYLVKKECEWLKEKKDTNNVFWDLFLSSDKFIKKRPKNRLIPRICIRSGFLETYILRWQQADFPDETFYHSDCNGLYAHISLTHPVPIGKYQVLLTNDIRHNITFDFNLGKHFFKGQPLSGSAAHVRILAPRNLKKPFLSFRSADNFNFMSLCHSCMEKKLTLCQHKVDSSRYFESCWMITELDKAVSLGYTILEWFEIHFFPQTSFLLSNYVSILSALKLQNTGCDVNMTFEEKQIYCDTINARLNVPEQFQLNPTNISENPGKKQFFKSMLNNYLGKFIQNTHHSSFQFVSTQAELEKYCFNMDNEIIGIYPFSEDLCQVEYKPTLTNIKPSKKSNLYIGAEIIAKARVHIYDCIEKLEAVSARIFFVDTDGIGYALNKNIENPLKFSNCTGDFKAVQNNIQSFHSLGNRNYTIGYCDSSNNLKYDYKVKGLTLTSEHSSNILSPELYSDFLDKHFLSDFTEIFIPQVRSFVNVANKKSRQSMHPVKFSNNLFVKRYIDPTLEIQTYETFPYGYQKN